MAQLTPPGVHPGEAAGRPRTYRRCRLQQRCAVGCRVGRGRGAAQQPLASRGVEPLGCWKLQRHTAAAHGRRTSPRPAGAACAGHGGRAAASQSRTCAHGRAAGRQAARAPAAGAQACSSTPSTRSGQGAACRSHAQPQEASGACTSSGCGTRARKRRGAADASGGCATTGGPARPLRARHGSGCAAHAAPPANGLGTEAHRAGRAAGPCCSSCRPATDQARRAGGRAAAQQGQGQLQAIVVYMSNRVPCSTLCKLAMPSMQGGCRTN